MAITFEECKIIVANKYGYGKLVTGHRMSLFDEAAELYAMLKVDEEMKESEHEEEIDWN